jgi:hypothetical protein
MYSGFYALYCWEPNSNALSKLTAVARIACAMDRVYNFCTEPNGGR